MNGQWSSWSKGSHGQCLSDCKWTVLFNRTCTNPAPTGGGLGCTGEKTKYRKEPCTGGRCPKGEEKIFAIFVNEITMKCTSPQSSYTSIQAH